MELGWWLRQEGAPQSDGGLRSEGQGSLAVASPRAQGSLRLPEGRDGLREWKRDLPRLPTRSFLWLAELPAGENVK